jgi:hypothetical protein
MCWCGAAVKKNWAEVKKDAAPPSQSGASVKPNEVNSQQQSADSNSNSSAKDQPGLMEKAERIIGTITGRSVGSNEKESGTSSEAEPKALGTLTGVIEIAPGNQSAANEAVANTAAALQGRTSVPIIIKGELKIGRESAAGTSSR